ncbi:MAG: ion channel [Kiloniellales bacterium]|nr:ion channel [Kiloniellales bacterium]MDJ0969638.1 ion channel [Kiloniellales bacterium]
MLVAMAVTALLVLMTIAIHYEALRLTSELAPKLSFLSPRPRLLFVVAAIFAAHTLEVWLWAFGYYIGLHWLGLGSFGGEPISTLQEMVYFSVVSYTTLGIGDIYPLEGLRLMTGVESLAGLLMITWSASFTYLTMEKYWPLHRERRRAPGAGAAVQAGEADRPT